MAISINPKTWGRLYDPFGGKADLRLKRIRVLHEKSFLDDPTRILRAARFKARLGLRVEAKTLKLLKSAIKIKYRPFLVDGIFAFFIMCCWKGA